MALLKIIRKGQKQKENPRPENIELVSKEELGISDAAEAYIQALLCEKGPSHCLRVAIRGGGCSGLSIHYEIADTFRDNDVFFSKNNAKVVIDKKSLSVLGGATLHCRDYLSAKEFMLVNNPAEKQCSCGKSFSL